MKDSITYGFWLQVGDITALEVGFPGCSILEQREEVFKTFNLHKERLAANVDKVKQLNEIAPLSISVFIRFGNDCGVLYSLGKSLHKARPEDYITMLIYEHELYDTLGISWGDEPAIKVYSSKTTDEFQEVLPQAKDLLKILMEGREEWHWS